MSDGDSDSGSSFRSASGDRTPSSSLREQEEQEQGSGYFRTAISLGASAISALSPSGLRGDTARRTLVFGEASEDNNRVPTSEGAEQQHQASELVDATNMASTSSNRAHTGMDITKFFSSTATASADELTAPKLVSRGKRGDTLKEQKRSKDTSTKGIKNKFSQMSSQMSALAQAAATLEAEQSIDNHVDTSKTEESIMLNQQKAREAHHDMDEVDLGMCFIVPKLKDKSAAPDSPDKWDCSDTANILLSPHARTLEECQEWTSNCLLYGREGTGTEHCTSLSAQDQEWGLLFMQHSCTQGLREAVMEVLDKMQPDHRGASVFIKVMFSKLYAMNEDSITALKNLLNNFKEYGPKNISGENVSSIKMLLMAAFSQLDACDELPTRSNCLKIVTYGLSQVTANREFAQTWEGIRDLTRNPFLDSKFSTDSNPSVLQEVEALLDVAVTSYNEHLLSQEWNAPAGGTYITCFNCEKEGCSVAKCKQPKDEERIRLNRQKFRMNKPPRTDDGKPLSQSGSQPNVRPYSDRGKFGAPTDGVATKKINRRVYTACGTCQAWTTGDAAHSKKQHEEWSSSGKASLGDSHPYVMMVRGKGPGKGKSGKRGNRSSKKRDDETDESDDVSEKAVLALAKKLGEKATAKSKTTAEADQANLLSMIGALCTSLKE